MKIRPVFPCYLWIASFCFIGTILGYESEVPAYFDNEWEWDIRPYSISDDDSKFGIVETKYNQKSPVVSKIHQYLPKTTWPISYVIKIKIVLESNVDEEELTAQGSVSILVKCLEPTTKFVMHADTKYLSILEDKVKVTETLLGRPLGPIPILNQTYEFENDFYTIQLASACKINREYLVEIDFVADIATDVLTGLYLSTYTDPNTNITKRLATTQFEAEWARQMFPHYDDPDYKATFEMIIGRHENYTSMSNMNIVKTEIDSNHPGWLWDYYARTPVMSSYLLALVVSDFTCVAAPAPGYKKHVEICGPPHMIELGGGLHSAEVVATVLEFYDRFMKQDYPLPKMTSVAIPDFEAGAMENWGLNTYRIKGLIYYPGITNEEARLRIDLTIAHELAHQNYGNLVTCKLWNQIWLNEGFATYISYYGLKSVSPEYDPDTLWLTGYRRRALLADGRAETHPLVNMSNPMFYFDGISYSKGASLLRMTEKILTPRIFHEGLQIYLAKHAYSNTLQSDLFEILDRVAFVSGVRPSVGTVKEILENWSLQSGYPLLRVEYVSDRVISLTQERFFDQPQTDSPTTHQFGGWYIPITIAHDHSTVNHLFEKGPELWMTNKEFTKLIHLDEDVNWVTVNHDITMFGRVLYDKTLAKRIEDQLNRAHDALGPLARAQIIDDMFELAWAEYTDVDTALDLTRYLANEHEPVVWSAALNGLGKIYSMFTEEETHLQLLKDYVYERISSSLAHTGIEQNSGDKGVSVMHRGSMLHWAGVLEIENAIQYAKQLVQTWANSSVNVVPPDLHSQTYCNAIIGSGRYMHDILTQLIPHEHDIDVQRALARGLACSKDESTLFELRQNLTTEDLPQDLSFEVLMKLARNTASRKTLVQYLDEYFFDIQEYFEGEKVFANSLELAVQYWNTEEHLTEVENFISKYETELSSVRKKLKRVVEQLKKNISWMEKFSTPIKKWLEVNK